MTNKLISLVVIIFFLSMMHYPPNISKLFMVFMAYSLYIVYLTEGYVDEK